MANYNRDAFIGSALKTVLAQTLRDIEVIVIDDASTDRSVEIAAGLARQDPRIRLLTSAANAGPGAARNIGLEQARGRWIAIVDSDDLIHPERLERLLRLAEAEDTDIAADNLLVFDDDPAVTPYAFLADDTAPRKVDLARYLLANAYGPTRAKLGYLKPLFRTEFVRQSGARYQPGLRVAEDASFVLALLAAGARFHIFPGTTYFYRKHGGSVSHRLTAGHVEAMTAEDEDFRARLTDPAPAVLRAFASRRRGFRAALEFDELVLTLKAGRWARAAVLALRRPGAALSLRQPVAARIGRLRRRIQAPGPATRRQACILTRRPVTAEGQEVMAPLIRLAELFAAGGIDPHLVIPTAIGPQQRAALGRAPGIGAFKTLGTRSGAPGLALPGESWGVEEKLFVARQARPLADVVVADWLPGVEALPFVLRPESLALALVEGLPRDPRTGRLAPGAERLARADAILAFDAADVPLLQDICPDTPIIALATGELFVSPETVIGLPLALQLAGLREALWPARRDGPDETGSDAVAATSRGLGAHGELQV